MTAEELETLADWLDEIALDQVRTYRVAECQEWATKVRRAAEEAS